MSLNTDLYGVPVFIRSNGFIGEFHSIHSNIFNDTYTITYVNKKLNSYCTQIITSLFITNTTQKDLIAFIIGDSELFNTPLYKLIEGFS